MWQILEHTPAEHPDHHNLKDALSKSTELCSQVNEGVREKENSDQLEWLQNHVHCDGLPEVHISLHYSYTLNITHA